MSGKLFCLYKSQKGYSLIEIMISLTILVIMAVGAIPLFVYIGQGTQANKSRFNATTIAQQVMEEIKQLPYEAFDEDGKLITDDEAVPQLGTHPGGNPFGSVPKVQTRFDSRGVAYVVRTTIDWVDDPSSDSDGTDFKRIRITVEAPSIFSGNITVSEDIHSWVAKEGEKRVFEAGHMQVEVMTSTGVAINNTYVEIKKYDPTFNPWTFDLSKTQSKFTASDGTALFGIIPEGHYKARVEMPPGMMIRPDVWLATSTDLEGNYSFPKAADNSGDRPDNPGPYSSSVFLQEHVLVSNWETALVMMNKINKPSYLEFELRNIFSKELYIEDIDNFILNTPFRPPLVKTDISGHNGQLNKDFLGALWPELEEGLYYSFGSINVNNGHAFLAREKNSSDSQKIGSAWNGTFNIIDEIISLVIWVGVFEEIFFSSMDPGQVNHLGPGAYIIKSNFEQVSNLRIELAEDTILYIDNSDSEDYLIKPGAELAGSGIVFVKNNMHLDSGAKIMDDVEVYVGGVFSKHSSAQTNGKVEDSYQGFIN